MINRRVKKGSNKVSEVTSQQVARRKEREETGNSREKKKKEQEEEIKSTSKGYWESEKTK